MEIYYYYYYYTHIFKSAIMKINNKLTEKSNDVI